VSPLPVYTLHSKSAARNGTRLVSSCSDLAPLALASPIRSRMLSLAKQENRKKTRDVRYGALPVFSQASIRSKLTLRRCVDKPGLLLKSKEGELTPAQIPYARDDNEWENKQHNDLLPVVKEVKPHVLIGTSTKAGAFTKEVVQEMAKHIERPVIFPLSNPTRLHEAKPQDLYDWTDGKVLVATGSPFPNVKFKGEEYEIGK
jgi:hypothetical protein